MFNIKQLVNKITDKGNGSPRVGESSASVLESEEQHSAEGFLCPPCMKAFPNPEALEEHYLKSHPMEVDTRRNDELVQVLRQEIEVLHASLLEEKSMSDDLRKEIEKMQTEIVKHNSEKCASKNVLGTLEETNIGLKSEVTLLRQQLTDELEKMSQLRKEKELLKDKLLTLAAQNDTLMTKTLQSQLNHRNSIDDAVLREELVRVQRLMDQMTLEKEKEVEILNVKVKELENTLNAVRQLQERTDSDLRKASHEHDQLMKYTDENYQLKRDLADQMAVQIKQEAEIRVLKEAVEGAQGKISELQDRNEKLEQQKQSVSVPAEATTEPSKSNEEQLKSENAALLRELESLKSQLSDLQKQTQNYKQKLQKQESDAEKLVETHAAVSKLVEVKFNEYTNKLKEKEEEIKKNLSQYNSQCNQKDVEISKIKGELKAIQEQIKEKIQLVTTLDAAKISLTAKVEEFTKITSEIEKQLNQLKLEKDGLQELLQNKEKEVTVIQNKLEETKKRLDNNISDLQVQKATVASLEDALNEARVILQEKDANLDKTATDYSSKIETLTAEFESQRKALENTMNEKVKELQCQEEKSAEKVQEINKLQASLAEVEEFAAQTATKLSYLEAKCQELGVLNNELKYKLKSSEEDKTLLTERCLTEQSKAQSSHQAYEECKRKLEDSVSALHELGRENQSLQMESAKLQGRKWADDSVVTNCTGCVKEFTLTIRKHHCRHCGQIFCNDCSLRTASVPSSKKPVRVCDVCYQELTAK